MKSLLILLGVSILASAATGPRVSRASLSAMEQSFDRRIERINIDDPLLLLGATRAIYIEGFGAVLTTEVNLIASAAISPFRPAFTKDEIAKLKARKRERLPELKRHMRDMLIASAASLDGVPAEEQMVVGVLIMYFPWEDSAGMPRQILLQAPKSVLLAAGRGNSAVLEASMRVQEH